jgi:Cu+-exporting ATPase
MQTPVELEADIACRHCGEMCKELIWNNEQAFCCEGCKQVHLILTQIDACDTSMMEGLDGIVAKGKFKTEKWDYLDDPEILSTLVSYQDKSQVHILFNLPQIHCSSCIWLIEHLPRINKAVLTSTVDFDKKEASVVYDPSQIKLSQLASLLDYIGYAALVSHSTKTDQKKTTYTNNTVLRIGIAGFCFSNIMMLSFPEYLATNGIDETLLTTTFSYISLLLSLPVIFYTAVPFFTQAWKGLRQRFLNIDAPIALAILITYGRSIYEITTQTGTGYLDSMSGIVFFMLIGRWFQEKTQRAISFERDYKSYFPLSSLVLNGNEKKYTAIEKIQENDILLIRNQELITADALLIKGNAIIDYSFVTGEKDPVAVKNGDIIYAGGKQIGSSIEVAVKRIVSASHLTRLWNNEVFHNKKNTETSFVHPWSNYFSIVLFAIALISGIYWEVNDPTNTWKAVTSVLIVACPCSLLLSSTFTFGNLMRIFEREGLFLKNANVIERLAEADAVVFDKTGTLTANQQSNIRYDGKLISHKEALMIKSIVLQSNHPLSRSLSDWSEWKNIHDEISITEYNEHIGQGIEARCEGHIIRLGRMSFVSTELGHKEEAKTSGSQVYVSINGALKGKFIIQQDYREGIFEMIYRTIQLIPQTFIVSGDNNKEEDFLNQSLPQHVKIHFNTSPEDKLAYIKSLQQSGKKVLMIGDGLNDAGALRQSDTGIAVTEQSNYFTPACDAMLDGKSLIRVDQLIQLARSGKKIVATSFALSIAYNIAGMYFATQALLSPLIAAILMPTSTISIILLTTLGARLAARLKTVERS